MALIMLRASARGTASRKAADVASIRKVFVSSSSSVAVFSHRMSAVQSSLVIAVSK
jgi:hypothetical protein